MTNTFSFPHFIWSGTMNTRLLVSLTTLVVILASAVDAQAQLPVRTRQLQLLGSTSGTLTQVVPATTTSYQVTWPSANATWPAASGTTQYFLRTAAGTAGNSDLSWYGVNGELVDNGGTTPANKYVAYWNDANTLTGEIGFQWDDATNTLTMGQSGQPAEILFTNGSQNLTLQADTSVALAHTYNLSSVTGGGTFFIPASTNKPTATGQLLVSNAANGSASWVANPLAGFERGVADPTDAAFTQAITLTVTPDANDVIVVTSYDISGTPSGNILSVTAFTGTTFTVTSSGPFLASERISYMFIPVP
jgi:hypothetical protein